MVIDEDEMLQRAIYLEYGGVSAWGMKGANMDSVELAKEHIEAYRRRCDEGQERWKSDHVDAMICIDFEGILAIGLALHDMLIELDADWRFRIAKGELQYDKDVDEMISSAFRTWLEACPIVEHGIVYFEGLGFSVERAETFHKVHAKTRSISRDFGDGLDLGYRENQKIQKAAREAR